MIYYLHLPILMAVVGAAIGIMVPTGKLGPITPPKPTPVPVNPAALMAPAPVWERIDESNSGYKPPVYNYILYDYVQKYGHHTLYPRQQDYYETLLEVPRCLLCHYSNSRDMLTTMNQTLHALVLAVVLHVVSSTSRPNFHADEESIDKVENLVQYEYQYSVDDGLSKGPVMDRWERRLGEYVKGGYSVVDPDGSVRTVDYEVDGHKGYHAIIRFNPPSHALLSAQQLAQSSEIFPEASPANFNESPSAPITTENIPPSPSPTANAPHNYHAKHPYINKFGYKDFKAAASTNIAFASAKLPPSPVNYNVGHKRSSIYYKTPAGQIIPGPKPMYQTFDLDALQPRQNATASSGGDPTKASFLTEAIFSYPKPIKRHSKLVKRFDSMRQAFY